MNPTDKYLIPINEQELLISTYMKELLELSA